jgi:DNA-binding transcriptional MerR regulator
MCNPLTALALEVERDVRRARRWPWDPLGLDRPYREHQATLARLPFSVELRKTTDYARKSRQVTIRCLMADQEFGRIYVAGSNPRLARTAKDARIWRQAMRQPPRPGADSAMQTSRAILVHRNLPAGYVMLQFMIAFAQLAMQFLERQPRGGPEAADKLRSEARKAIADWLQQHLSARRWRRGNISKKELRGITEVAALQTAERLLGSWNTKKEVWSGGWIYPSHHKEVPKYVAKVYRGCWMETARGLLPSGAELTERHRPKAPGGPRPAPAGEPNRMTAKQAAAWVGCSVAAIYNYERRGLLQAVGKEPKRFDRQQVEELAQYVRSKWKRKRLIESLISEQGLSRAAAQKRVQRQQPPLEKPNPLRSTENPSRKRSAKPRPDGAD